MSKLIVLRGLPGSGKTTWARQWVAEDPDNRVRVNRDDLRMMFYGKKVDLSQKQETQISRAERALVREYLNRGLSVVLDAMNLHERGLKDWDRIHPFELREFDTPTGEILHRNTTRPTGDRLPEDALRRLIGKWYSRSGDLKKAAFRSDADFAFVPYDRDAVGDQVHGTVICDLDGTLALHTSGRSPYDYSRVYEDSVNEAVFDLIRLFSFDGDHIVFVSGREDSCREDTIRWLEDHCGLEDPELYMRKTGDKRDDTLVKYEIFDQHLRDRWIDFALDDRTRIVQMWRKINVPCFQVNEGDF